MSNAEHNPKRRTSAILWVLAVVITFAAADFQRNTGPTKEFTGSFAFGGESRGFELVRSGNTNADAAVIVPNPEGAFTGLLYFKRYPTDDPFKPVPMETVAEGLQGLLPAQLAAGKLEYYVVLESAEGSIRIPEDDNLILRFKDPVPLGVLISHIAFIFLALLVGVRTALGAAFHPVGLRKLAWTTLGLMSVGGMVLGPIVQKYAFGAFWTGWPNGHDLTDNKTLIMWVVWVVAVAVLAKRPSPRDRLARGAILAAAIVMMVVYLIPHSLRGSELDYSQVEEVSVR